MDGKNMFCLFLSNFKKRPKCVPLDQNTPLKNSCFSRVGHDFFSSGGQKMDFMQGKDVFRVIPGVFGNISKCSPNHELRMRKRWQPVLPWKYS